MLIEDIIMRTWIVIALVLSLMLNAMIIGFFISKPMKRAIPRMPFPPAPPGISHEIVPGLRDHFFQSRDDVHKHLNQLRTNLAVELAKDNTNAAAVDSLLDAISDEQRAMQESIIAYIDSLKDIVPQEEKQQLYDWILEHFGHMRSEKRGFRRPPRQFEAPNPESPPQPNEY